MSRTYIIAEAGVNHNGKIDLAKKMIDCSKDAGADAVKFQTFIADNLVSDCAVKAKYQKLYTDKNESQKEMLKKLELSFDEFAMLKEYCDDIEIDFLSTPFDSESIIFLTKLNMNYWKIPSGEITNLPYLIQIAHTNKPVILSTGMCTINEIQQAIDLLYQHGTSEIALLHCTTQYPAPFSDINLRAINTLKEKFNVKAGYSDHTLGIEVPIAAVAIGAEIIEKHFTLDKTMNGPDQKISLEPHEFKNMVDSIRNIEKALGTGEKAPSGSEYENIEIVRKSIVAKSHIAKGDIFTIENLTTKRPGKGISPMKWFDIIGQVSKKNFNKDDLIEI